MMASSGLSPSEDHYPLRVLETARFQAELCEIADLLPDRGSLRKSATCQVRARLLREGDALFVEIEAARVGDVDPTDIVYGGLVKDLRERAPCWWPAMIVGGWEMGKKGKRAFYGVRLAATDPPGGPDLFAAQWWQGR